MIISLSGRLLPLLCFSPLSFMHKSDSTAKKAASRKINSNIASLPPSTIFQYHHRHNMFKLLNVSSEIQQSRFSWRTCKIIKWEFAMQNKMKVRILKNYNLFWILILIFFSYYIPATLTLWRLYVRRFKVGTVKFIHLNEH